MIIFTPAKLTNDNATPTISRCMLLSKQNGDFPTSHLRFQGGNREKNS